MRCLRRGNGVEGRVGDRVYVGRVWAFGVMCVCMGGNLGA